MPQMRTSGRGHLLNKEGITPCPDSALRFLAGHVNNFEHAFEN